MKAILSQLFLSKAYQNPLPAVRVGSFKLTGGGPLLHLLLVLLIVSNLGNLIWSYVRPDKAPEGLYLMEKAAQYTPDLLLFEAKVREIAARLDVPPEWLMAVMYSESRFDAKALNFRGSGATGLIQFMPETAKTLGTTTQQIGKLTHEEQMEWVYRYMQLVRDKYGEYESLTDFYLAILYPKARRQEMCYVMYAKPSRAYLQNSGLDLDKDGSVTVSEIDKRMRKLYPTAYMKKKPTS